jgi:hypothetical protein
VNDSVRYTATYVLEGDIARVTDWVLADGSRRTASIGTTSPAMLLVTERNMLESALSMAAMQSRLATPTPIGPTVVMGARSNPVPKPASPVAAATYDPSPAVRIVHTGDTVQYISGCAPATRVDTTTFVLFGADSVRRVRPARTFGPSMVASLLGQIQMTAVRQNIASRDGQMMTGVPGSAPQCQR